MYVAAVQLLTPWYKRMPDEHGSCTIGCVYLEIKGYYSHGLD